MSDKPAIDHPLYRGQSKVRVVAEFHQGNERYTRACYAYSTRAAILHLIPDMSRDHQEEAIATLGRPNDFHAKPYKGYGWWTIIQDWAWKE